MFRAAPKGGAPTAMHPMLTTAVKAARRAGNVINRGARDLDLLKVSSKGPKDFVSEIDHAAEAAIVETLLGAYPTHAILAEEGTAFLNDRRIRVIKRHHLRDCLIGTGFPFRDGSFLDTYLAMMKEMITHTAGLRRPGAAALDLAYVAAGCYDGFFEVGLNPWDVAAGSLLVLEAGGLIGDLSGEGDYLRGGQVIAANPKIFAQMVQALSPFRAAMAREVAQKTPGA